MNYLKKVLILILVLALNLNCHNSCKYDLNFEKYFDSAIQSVNNDLYSEGNILEKYINPENAKFFLVLITQIEMEGVHKGEYYRDEDAYKKIEAKWRKWYNHNKCTFTMKNADAIYHEYYVKRNQDSIFTWSYKFPTDWKLLFTKEKWGVTDFYGEPEILDESEWMHLEKDE